MKGSTTIKAIPQKIANGPPQKSKLKTDVFESRNTRKLFTSWARMENAGCSKRFPLRVADGPRLVRCEDVRVLTREELRQLTGK